MAVYKIFPEKDATIYSLFPFMNTGVDEIIEATTTTFAYDFSPQTSRTLIKFSTPEINKTVDDIIGGWDNVGDVKLKLFIATAEGLNDDTLIETYPISGAWSMGTGKYLDDPVSTNGCSWQWYDFSGSHRWPLIPSLTNYVTTSMDPMGVGGGATWWYKNPQNDSGLSIYSQSINYTDPADLNFDVTSLIEIWYSSSKGLNDPGLNSISNEGFIVKQSGENEFVYTPNKATELKYFSIDTNTIYPPLMEFRWRDVSFDTGSSPHTIIDDRDLVISLQDNPSTFRPSSIYDFRINARPKYPARVYQTASLYTTNYYLPSESYYAIKDLDTNEFVIGFDDEFTQISADENSNYFKLYMNGLEPERYYQILVKTLIGRDTLVLESDLYFKVING